MLHFKDHRSYSSAEQRPAAKLCEHLPMFLGGHYSTSFRTFSIAARRVFISESSVPMEASEAAFSD